MYFGGPVFWPEPCSHLTTSKRLLLSDTDVADTGRTRLVRSMTIDEASSMTCSCRNTCKALYTVFPWSAGPCPNQIFSSKFLHSCCSQSVRDPACPFDKIAVLHQNTKQKTKQTKNDKQAKYRHNKESTGLVARALCCALHFKGRCRNLQ